MKIDINTLTLGEIKEIAALVSPFATPTITREMGTQIVVLDRGFVYVGKTTVTGDSVTITDAKNIRYWGTTKGLAELRDGPIEGKTKLDDAGTVIVPIRAVIHFIKCNRKF